MILLRMTIFTSKQIKEIREIRSSIGLRRALPGWYVALKSEEQAEVILSVYLLDLFEVGGCRKLA